MLQSVLPFSQAKVGVQRHDFAGGELESDPAPAGLVQRAANELETEAQCLERVSAADASALEEPTNLDVADPFAFTNLSWCRNADWSRANRSIAQPGLKRRFGHRIARGMGIDSFPDARKGGIK
jgi:hypothetical protein